MRSSYYKVRRNLGLQCAWGAALAGHDKSDQGRRREGRQGAESAGRPGREILFVIGSLEIGGAERHLSLIASRLKRRGWRPTIFCFDWRGAQAGALIEQGIEVIGPADPVARRPGRRLRMGLRLAGAGVRLLTRLIRRPPAVVHFFLPLSYVLGGPLAILARAPIRVMSRRSLNLYQHKHAIGRRVERRLHRHMTAILGNSRRVVAELVDDEGCDPRKVGIIYNGVEVSRFASAAPANWTRKAGGDGEAALVLITVANLIPYKGHADLFAALAIAAGRLPKPWRLLCVGRDDGYGQTLQDEVRRLGIEENVRFLGQQGAIASLLKAADIGLLCSHQEGFSNAILEGMAAGLPMIVTDVGGNSEAIDDSLTGLLVPPRDPVALSNALLKLAQDPAARRRLGEAAQARAESEFDIDRCVDRYHQLYRGLIEDDVFICERRPKRERVR